MRSATAVSNAMRRVRNAGSETSTAANTLAYTTLVAIEPDWSTHRMTSPERSAAATIAHQLLRNEITLGGLIAAQVAQDGAPEVDLVGPRGRALRRLLSRLPIHGLAQRLAQVAQQLAHHLLHDGAPRWPWLPPG